jgi:iron complex outermembrane receptor protein
MIARAIVGGLVLGSLASGVSIAQTADPSAAAAEPASGLQAVIVTAQRRVENIQEVPDSVVAFGPADILQLGMTQGFDLANQVPNMNIDAPTAESTVRYFIRGVGTQDFGTLATSPIALYIDDVYLGSTIANSVSLYDVQRVEVLLGPQGTLWGKNTTGGAINFISAHPTQTLESYGSGAYGNHGERLAQGMVNVPLSSTLAVRAAFTYSGRNAWITNQAPNGPHNLDAYNKAGGRISFEWIPSDELRAYLKGEYLKRTGSTITGHMVPLNGVTDAFGDPPLPLGVANQAPGPSSDDFATWDITARLDWSVAGFATLSSISAWQSANRIHEYELDSGTPFLILNQAFFGKHDQFTEEVRLVSGTQGPWRWQGGWLYYFARESAMSAVPFNEVIPSAPPGFVTADLWPEARRFSSNSVFGGGEYEMAAGLIAKAGLRYNADEGSYHAMHYSIDPYADYLNYLNPNPSADPNSRLIPADTINARADWSKLTWDAGLRHVSADNNKMIYFNAGTGYRQGSFSSPSGASADEFSILRPETNLALEIGAKSSWLHNSLQLNVAGFSYHYSNMQVFILQPILAGAPLAIERNAARANDRGGELELRSAPTVNWLLTADVGYTHALFTQFNTTTSTGIPISLAGNRFPRQPDWTASTSLQYRIVVRTGGDVLLHTDWNYRGDYYVNADNLHNPYIPSRTIGNVRASYLSERDTWELGVYARNVTDKHYPMGGFRLGLAMSDILYFGDPITFGADGSIRF